MRKEPEYSYEPKGRDWVVYHWKITGVTGIGTKVFQSSDREEARKECYRLNGWKYKKPEQ